MNKKTKIIEAIILAGGLGTRLKSEIGEYPKPLAPINGIPFLEILLDYLKTQNIKHVVLAVGYKWELIQEKFGDSYNGISIQYSVEEKPLGTGGAIKLALEKVKNESVFVLNGDTIFNIDLGKFANLHLSKKANCSLALKKVYASDRYGTVEINTENKVIDFIEKKFQSKALINGGVYCVQKDLLHEISLNTVFSFENDFLAKEFNTKPLFAFLFDTYFKDIGIPTDYRQFEKDIKNNVLIMQTNEPLQKLKIDASWTLFLDRDGVINVRLIDDYVKQLNELRIIENVPEAIASFAKLFGRIVVVTNQQGIGRGMMTADDLSVIHGYIEDIIQSAGGRIDTFYFAPQLKSENSNYRKPETGMGLQAKIDYPEIDFKKSVMIGDSESDIEFGMKLGMKTIMLKNDRNLITKADYIFRNLYHVSQALILSND